jgi:hypothetical protein
MKLGTVVKTSFIVSFIISLVGAWLKITHSKRVEISLVIGIISTLVFMVTAIYEVRTSKRINNSEKNMWTLAFIFFSGIAGLIYFFMGRRRIATNN